MKKKYFIRVIITMALILTMTACKKAEDKKVTIKEPDKTITVIEDSKQEEKASEPAISVDKIERYDKVSITDWLDEATVIASKENESLSKFSLAELSEYYPRSLYFLDITSKDYKLIKEQEEVNLDGAVLSDDKKYLLYNEYTLGDPAFYILNLDTKEGFGIKGDPIAGAMSAEWTDNETVMGLAYAGGAYLADRSGNISLVEDLKEDALYLVTKINNRIYYNTVNDGALMRMDLDTKEKADLDLSQVYDMIPSPDRKQMLILQADGTKNTMLVYDLESEEKINIAEGIELNGVSWSPDQRRIAYKLKEDKNRTLTSNLYIYDVLTGESTQIAVGIDSPNTRWSPSGNKLAYTEWDGTQFNSSIINLKFK